MGTEVSVDFSYARPRRFRDLLETHIHTYAGLDSRGVDDYDIELGPKSFRGKRKCLQVSLRGVRGSAVSILSGILTFTS